MIESFLKDYRVYHTQLQQDHFITAKTGITTFGMYTQALRELFSRRRNLRELYCDKEIALIDIDELKNKKSEDDVYQYRRNTIEIQRKTLQLEEMTKNIAEVEREYNRFYNQAKVLKEKLGDITPERRLELETEYHVASAKKQVSEHKLANVLGLPVNIIGHVLAFPKNERAMLINDIQQNTNQLIDEQVSRDIIFNLPENNLSSDAIKQQALENNKE